jgi:hypothetical protein
MDLYPSGGGILAIIHPRCFVLPPNAIPPEQVIWYHRYLSAGAVREDRHFPVLHFTRAFYFIS